MIVKTDAIILRSMKYGETSKILTLYTRDFGRMGVIVKGARSATSKFGAALDIMSHSSVVMYKKEQRDLQLLTQADLIRQYRGIIDHADRLMYGFVLLEYISATVHGEEAHEELYTVLEQSLSTLDSSDTTPAVVLLHYLLRLIHALGLGLDVRHCVHCRADLSEVTSRDQATFSDSQGGFFCGSCRPYTDGKRVRPETLEALRALDGHPLMHTTTLQLTTHAAKEGLQLLQGHCAFHMPEMRQVKSLHLLDLFS